MADTHEHMSDTGAAIGRACDQCRNRKVRCGKVAGAPCFNCRSAGRECTSTGLGKIKDTRQRVSITNQYERKIERVDARLAGIESMLANLTTITTSLNRGDGTATLPNYTTPSLTEASTAYESLSTDEEEDQTFEGDSSMTAHTVLASHFLEQAVTNTPLSQKLNPDIQSALASLRQMVQLQHINRAPQRSSFPRQISMPKGGLNQLPLPPTDVVLKLLREIKVTPSITFVRDCVFITVDAFIEYCRRVFFATEEYGTAVFIIVNAGLYLLLEEKSVMGGTMKDEYHKYQCLCRDNLDTALATLPLLMPPRREMVEALLLGVSHSIEMSRFTLAWQLNSAAATMCQSLGWHRLQATEAGDVDDTNPAAFWFCYMLDKGFSLRFGRTSVIRDLDISIPRRSSNMTHMSEPWKNIYNLWIQTGSVLGETYDNLYSAAALARPQTERIETAKLLAEKSKQLFRGLKETSSVPGRDGMFAAVPDRSARDKMETTLRSAEVTHLATLTLIYRAIPSSPGFPSTFNQECIDAARMAFECHEQCMKLASGSPLAQVGYLNWTILYAPFTPLVVIFCHIIEKSNLDDLQRLAQFTASLEPVLSLSPAMEKLHRLCKVLYQVATLYVEAKAQANDQKDHDMTVVGNNFDVYLSQLGFISPQHTVSGTSVGSGDGFGQTPSQLADWFTGNTSILGLMEEDTLDFDFDFNTV